MKPKEYESGRSSSVKSEAENVNFVSRATPVFFIKVCNVCVIVYISFYINGHVNPFFIFFLASAIYLIDIDMQNIC